MVILLFGVSNVGKTTVGKKLAQRLGFSFFDLDEEIKERFQTTIGQFVQDHPFPDERFKIKGEILRELINSREENSVIAVSLIYYARYFNPLLKLDKVIAIELQDTKEHIFERLVFSDENDLVYEDEAYKNEHRSYYLKDIQEDITYTKRIFKKIENKYFINNKSVDQVVDGLIELIGDISTNNM